MWRRNARAFLLSFSLSLSLFTLSLSYSYSLSFYLKSKIFARRIRFQPPIRRYSFYSDLIAMVIFLTLCSFFSFFLSLLSLFLFAHYINTHLYKVYKPDRPQTTNANEKEKQLKIAPHATSTKNGSPSATCATTFCAACEASGEMTVAAMRAVVAMAVCLIRFVVHGIV